jgi:hypothetical protein
VVRLLNERSAISKKLESIVDQCNRLAELNAAFASNNEKAYSAEIGRVLETLNGLLSVYRWQPVVSVSSAESFALQVRFGFQARTRDEHTENRAVDWLIRHIPEIHNIRRCQRDQCQKWYWVTKDPHKYCSDNCRKSSHARDPNLKKARAAYMRQYRADEKQRELKAKKLVSRGKAE